MVIRVSVGTFGRMEPPSAHDDARGRKTRTPTAHNHAPRPGRTAGIRPGRLVADRFVASALLPSVGSLPVARPIMSTAADVLAARISPLAIMAGMSSSANHSIRTVS
jgi:hypothetical protein